MDDTETLVRQTVLDCFHGIIDGQVTNSAATYLVSHQDSPKSDEMKAHLDNVRRGLELMRTNWDKLPTLVFLADVFARPNIIRASDRVPGQLNMRQAFLAHTGLDALPDEDYFPLEVKVAPKTSNFGQHCRMMHWAWHHAKRIRSFMNASPSNPLSFGGGASDEQNQTSWSKHSLAKIEVLRDIVHNLNARPH